MSNKILTNSIVDPTIQQPWTGPELAFLQNNISEQISGLGTVLVGSTYALNTPYIMFGLTPTGSNRYSEGWIFYNNELYYSSGKTSTTAFSNVPVFVLTITNDPTVDPLMFSDSIARNVTNIRRMNIVDAVSGSGTFDYSACIFLPIVDTWHPIGSGIGFQNSWVDSGVSGYALARYKKVGNIVYLGGVIKDGASASIAFQLPSGYRPTYVQEAITAVEGITGANAAGNFTVDNNGQVTLTYPSTRSYIVLDNMFFHLD